MRDDTLPLPQSDDNDELQQQSLTKFASAVPAHLFMFHSEPVDKGVDKWIAAKCGRDITNYRACVQVKSTDDAKLNVDGSASYPVELSNLNYLCQSPSAVYVLWIRPRDELRFCWARDERDRIANSKAKWQGQKTVTLHFIDSLNAEAFEAIHARVLREGRAAVQLSSTAEFLAVPATTIEQSSSSVAQNRDAAITSQVTSLVPDTALLASFGVPPNVIFNTAIDLKPPPAPRAHVTRSSITKEITQRLNTRPILGLIGPSGSGKTAAVADFARSTWGRVLWFSCPLTPDATDAWQRILCLTLSQLLNTSTFSLADLTHALAEVKSPLLVVVDNAHVCSHLQSLTFLFTSAEANPTLKVVLVGNDDPRFVHAIRAHGLPLTRLDGFSKSETEDYFRLLGGRISPTQRSALVKLRAVSHGHPALLRMSHERFRQVQKQADLRLFNEELDTSLGPGADALAASLFERFQLALQDEERELCRRLSLPLLPFTQQLAAELWAIDHNDNSFSTVWTQAMLRVLDQNATSKFTVPSVYRRGLSMQLSIEDVRRFHGLIAECIDRAEAGHIGVQEVEASISHRVLSGDSAAAVRKATSYLALALIAGADKHVHYLLHQLSSVLASVLSGNDVDPDLRIRWHILRLRCLDTLDRPEDSAQEVTTLRSLLERHRGSDEARMALRILLGHAYMRREPALAIFAGRMLLEARAILSTDSLDARTLAIVIATFVSAESDPSEYLVELFANGQDSDLSELWFHPGGFELWSGVSAILYKLCDESAASAEITEGMLKRFVAVANAARDRNQSEIAAMLLSAVARVELDVRRQFAVAASIAEQAVAVSMTHDHRVRNNALQMHGDALRCLGRLEEALNTYNAALACCREEETFEPSQTLLMIAICKHRLNDTSALNDAREAAQIADDSRSLPFQTSRCLLEAGAIALQQGRDAVGLRLMAKAHGLLRKHRGRAEWIGLAQLAFGPSGFPRDDTEHPGPCPGFTLGLRDTIPDGDKMLPSAPTMMLARAFAEAGSPHRAMYYYDLAFKDRIPGPARGATAAMALESALVAEHLPNAARYVSMAVRGSSSKRAAMPNWNSYLWSFLCGRVGDVVINSLPGRGRNDDVAVAQGILDADSEKHPALKLLAQTIRAFSEFAASGNDELLNDIFIEALKMGATPIARQIAWFWCFRVSASGTVSELTIALWQWRLSWTTRETSQGDADFLLSFVRQQRAYWPRLKGEKNPIFADRIEKALSFPDDCATDVIDAIGRSCAEMSLTHLPVPMAVNELVRLLGRPVNAVRYSGPLMAFAHRVLALLCSPRNANVARSKRKAMAKMLRVLAARLAESGGEQGRDTYAGLAALAGLFSEEEPAPNLLDAVLSLRHMGTSLEPSSAAYFYSLLRYSAVADPTNDQLAVLQDALCSPHALEVGSDHTVEPSLRLRLATCQHFVLGMEATQRLASTMTLLRTQEAIRAPVSKIAREDYLEIRAGALRDATRYVEALTKAEADAKELGVDGVDLLMCASERGTLRTAVGAAFRRFEKDEAAMGRWFRLAIGDFLQVLAYATEATANDGCILEAAIAGRSLCEVLDDNAHAETFDAEVRRFERAGGHEERIKALQQREARLLRQLETVLPERPVWTETLVQEYTDYMLAAWGLPADRSPFVEQDVRNLATTDHLQQMFCKHLQPLQNLKHTLSPRTAYTEPTRHTCECTLLGHQTQFELSDFDAAIRAMKTTYCNQCSLREPASAPAIPMSEAS